MHITGQKVKSGKFHALQAYKSYSVAVKVYHEDYIFNRGAMTQLLPRKGGCERYERIPIPFNQK